MSMGRSPTSDNGNRIQQKQLRRAIASLPRAQRDAVIYLHFLEMTQEEAAFWLKVSQQSVCTNLKRGINNLRLKFGIDVCKSKT